MAKLAARSADRRVIAKRIYDALCDCYPDKYIALIQPSEVADAPNTNWCGSKLKNLFRISRYHVENAVANYPAPKVVLFSNTFHWLIAPGGGLVVAILTRPSPN